MTWGSNKMHFTHDTLGPATVTYGNSTYYYLRNAQGDIVGIANSSGTQVVSYRYDAWGNILDVSGTMASTLGQDNPFRYRGYVYDNETGLYYLTSRYYDPCMGRFINADGYISTGQDLSGNNMFTYCGNNPVFRKDDNGDFWNIVIGGIVGGLIAGATTYFKTGDIRKAVVSTAVGAIAGAVAASGLSLVAQVGITMVTTAAGDMTTQAIDIVDQSRKNGSNFGAKDVLESIDYKQTVHNTVLSGGLAVLGSGLGSLTSHNYTSLGKEVYNAAQDKLLTAYVKQSVGQSGSALIRQSHNLLTQANRFINIGRGISSVTGTVLTWAPSIELSMP